MIRLLFFFCTLLWILPIGNPALGVVQDDVPEVVRRLLDEGRRHLQEGRAERAVEILTEAASLDSRTAQVYLDLGAAQAGTKDVAAAVSTFERGLEVDPHHRDLLYNAAVLRLRLGEPEVALRHVETALQRDVSSDLLQVQAGCLARLERHEEALEALRRAETEEPRSARLQFAIGNQLHRLGRLDDAAGAFEQALRFDSKLIRASYNLGAVLVELGRFQEAGAAYEDALAPLKKALRRGERVEKIHAVAFANLGAAYTQREQWEDAAQAYEAATRIDPQHADAFLNLGFAFFQMKKWKDATQAYQKAVELDPGLALAYLQLGEIAHERGRCAAAVEWLERGLAVLDAEGRLGAMERMARCYTELGRSDDAEQTFRKVLAEVPSDPAVLADFGSVLRRNGRLEEAWETLSRSLELRGDLSTRLEALAVAEATNRAEDRERLLRSVEVEQDPQRLWPVCREVAVLDLRAGRWDAASTALDFLAGLEAVPETERRWAASWASIASWLAGRSDRAGIVGNMPALALVRHAETGRADDALKIAATLPEVGPVLLAHAFLDWERGQVASAAGRLAAARLDGYDGGTAGVILDAELRLQQGDGRGAAAAFEKAVNACRTEEKVSSSRGNDGDGSYWAVTRPAGDGLCAMAAARLPVARLQAALGDLRRAPAAARQAARAVRESSATQPELRDVARWIEGTALLMSGSPRSALSLLEGAAEGSLPAEWQDAAWINLGVAQTVLGQTESALRSFSRAEAPSAVLNAAILRQDHLNDPEGALELYERYLALGGSRRGEVQGWVDHLRELYR